jgi:hypothetical protein
VADDVGLYLFECGIVAAPRRVAHARAGDAA